MADQNKLMFSVNFTILHRLNSGEVVRSEKQNLSGVNWSVEVKNVDGSLFFYVLCETNLSCQLKLSVEQSGCNSYKGYVPDGLTIFSTENNYKSDSISMFERKANSSSHFPFKPFHFLSTLHCKVIVSVSKLIILNKKRKTHNLMERIGSFLFAEESADVYILTDGNTRIPAHKFMLMAGSPVFKAMLTSTMSESIKNEIKISDVSDDVLRAFLQYFYDIKIENISEIAIELVELAHKYDVADLVAECEAQLCSTIDVDSVVDLLLLSEKYSLTELKQKALDFIAHNSVVAKEPCFLERITPDLHIELLGYMTNKLNATTVANL